jgi:hypothetical protein
MLDAVAGITWEELLASTCPPPQIGFEAAAKDNGLCWSVLVSEQTLEEASHPQASQNFCILIINSTTPIF